MLDGKASVLLGLCTVLSALFSSLAPSALGRTQQMTSVSLEKFFDSRLRHFICFFLKKILELPKQ